MKIIFWIYVVPLVVNALTGSENQDGTRVPLWKKANPLWLLGNDDDPITQHKYRNRYPGAPTWIRRIRHGIRNPAANGVRYFWGAKDKGRWIRGDDMWPRGGWIHVTLPWIAFSRWGICGYAGWNCGIDRTGMNYGALTFCLRRAKP